MELSKGQWEMLGKLRGGVNFWLLGEAERETLRFLESLGLARAREDHGPGRWELTEAGRRALDVRALQMEQAAEQQAKQERQQRFENKISIAGVLVPLVIFALGIVIERYKGLVPFPAGLFRGWVKNAIQKTVEFFHGLVASFGGCF